MTDFLLRISALSIAAVLVAVGTYSMLAPVVERARATMDERVVLAMLGE